MTGYHIPGEELDLAAEGCNFDAIRRWMAEGVIYESNGSSVATTTKTQPAPKPEPAAPQPTQPPPPVPVWNLDPEALKTKSLATLNVMIAERDPDKGPFDTEEEAIAQLTMDRPKTRGRAVE